MYTRRQHEREMHSPRISRSPRKHLSYSRHSPVCQSRFELHTFADQDRTLGGRSARA
jgi:hypothetical protein